ncbi:MAG: amino acid decarboxylase [Oscillospiraceae bacterium]|jgi:arginine/lysine/ornithine decarboxylase|nr:amino acid decarboxylase [Oscillospiraceae bacterium]
MTHSLAAALGELAARGTHRFHMPGHKGVLPPPFDGAARIDFTELGETGSLYTEQNGHIRMAEARCARLYGAQAALFLTGGATQGVFAALAALTKPGDTVALDRNCHKSALHALAMLGLRPLYLTRERLAPFGISAALTPRPLPEDIACVFLTCPTYYGVLSEDRAWRTESGREIPVIADAAHGAHLMFLPGGQSPLHGARIAVCSAHKTLPALGQAAFMLLSDARDAPRARYMTSVFGTSSPSYPMLASMDGAFSALERDGKERWAEVGGFAESLRREFGSVLSLTHNAQPKASIKIDAARLCLYTGCGYRDALRIAEDFGVMCEMADDKNIVFILSPNDTPESRKALRAAIGAVSPGSLGGTGTLAPLPLPETVLCPREAFFAPREQIRLEKAAGRVAAEPLAPYPPGVPLVAPGEKIDKKHIAILRELCYDGGEADFSISVIKEEIL